MKRFTLFAAGVLTMLAITGVSLTFAGNDLSDLIEQEKATMGSVYKVCNQDLVLARKAVITFKANLLETNEDKTCHYMQLDSEDIMKLEPFGFSIEPATSWIDQKLEALDNLKQKVELQALTKSLTKETTAIPGYDCYETVEETFVAAQGIATSHPDLATWIDIGNSWEKENGLGGYDMKVLKLTNSSIPGTKPILFINSAMHAREYATAPLVLNFATYLVENYGIDADATWILDYHEIHMLLHTNPDGRKMAETGLYWRKNTNTDYCGPTSNNRGADLNRNFTFGWNTADGSSGYECDEDYRGPIPGSEPEIQAVQSYVRSIFDDNRGPAATDAAPDDTSGIHLDIHSYSELVLWPWGSTSDIAPNGSQMQTLGRKFAYWNGYTPEQSIGLYPTDGTSDGVSYGELGVPAFTFELGTSFFQKCTTYTNTIVPDNMPALIYAAKVVRTPYITPAGPNAEDIVFSSSTAAPGSLVTITATISDSRFNNSNGTEITQNIIQAEYYIDTPPWETSPTPVAISMAASDGSFDEKTEEVTAVIDTAGWALGKYMIFVQGKDGGNVMGAVSAGFLTISEAGTTPVITSCDPATGGRKDRLNISVYGSNFDGGASVDFGSKIRILDTTIVSDTRIDLRIKILRLAALGARDVIVTNLDGEYGVLTDGFRVTE
ncbi:MAG: carboxypeptidase [Desulfobacteraceae bacterium]|nr:carboxypeptidase [Desulfobacteraceae bacterium]